MINNHSYYRVLEMKDLAELLTEVTQKYGQALHAAESERVLDSYRDLITQLHKEIEQRTRPEYNSIYHPGTS